MESREKESRHTDFEIWSDEQHDQGDYPLGFDPDLYDL